MKVAECWKLVSSYSRWRVETSPLPPTPRLTFLLVKPMRISSPQPSTRGTSPEATRCRHRRRVLTAIPCRKIFWLEWLLLVNKASWFFNWMIHMILQIKCRNNGEETPTLVYFFYFFYSLVRNIHYRVSLFIKPMYSLINYYTVWNSENKE